ncbi:MAG TPA: pilus assembly protein N-terminal domain-containing protein [Planctomicrobium sp.]|nr:pilus assembly protein N-terminal domain-containing protein [Planctomicrobium sp.]
MTSLTLHQFTRFIRGYRVGLFSACLTATLITNHSDVAHADGPELRKKVNELVEEVISSELEFKVTKRRSKVLRMKQDIFRAAVADPSILEFVAFGSREIEIIGKETGSTSVTLWLGDQDNPRLLSLLVTVVKDDAVDDQRRLEYGELAGMVNELFPNSRIQLFPIADKLIVRGQARDEQEAVEIMSIIRENSQQLAGGMGGGMGMNPVGASGMAAQPFPDGSTLPTSNIINMLKIPGEKQVMLKVRIAELKRSAFREMGADFSFDIKEFMFSSMLGAGGNVLASGTFNDGSFDLVLRAMMTNGTAKILAEPNLVTLSGQTATFLAGGEFAVPTVVGVGGAQAATTSFKGFGTQLTFTPTVLDKDRIRLVVNPSFSTLNAANSVQGIFGIDTRTAMTTVDLREGQVLAIAGLLQEQQRGENARIPFIGDIPGLNILTSNKTISRDETELLILVTPELVHPLEPEQAPSILPGMEVTEPNDYDFFVYGDIEGRNNCHHRSTVWPLFKSRMKRCGNGSYEAETIHASQNYYVNGSFGYSN